LNVEEWKDKLMNMW